MFELRPSAASAWLRCVGYARLNATLGESGELIERDNEVRDDGTACHWLAYWLWMSNVSKVGDFAPNGRELTEEMFAAVEEYHDLLKAWNCPITMEQKVSVSRVFPGVSDGTPDAYGVTGRKLRVADLKFGFRPVEVWRLPQLMVYGWTLVCTLGIPLDTVEFTIFQPRCAHYEGTTRIWTVTVVELEQLVQPLMRAAAAAYGPNPICTPNPACGDCGGAHACKALQAAGGASADMIYDSTPHVLTPVQLGYELARLKQAATHVEHRINGLEVQAESLAKRGTRIPGFDMTRAGTHWRWKEGTQAYIQQLGKLFGVDVMKEPRVKTVAKLRKAFPFDVEKMYAEKPLGELRLKLTDPNEATKRFSQRNKE